MARRSKLARRKLPRASRRSRVSRRQRVGRRVSRLHVLRGALVPSSVAMLSAGLLALGLACASAMGGAGEFRLTRLGLSGVDADTALCWLQNAGVRPGDPLLGIDLSALRTLLRRNPEVRDVVVRRCGGKGELFIGVSWWKPVATVVGADLYGISAGGVVLSPRVGEAGADLPVITGVPTALVHPGERIDDPGVQRALALLRFYCEEGVSDLAPLSEIHVSDDGVTTLYTVGDATQILVGEGDAQGLMRRLRAVVADLRARGTAADYIDMRFRRPVVRPRDTATYKADAG